MNTKSDRIGDYLVILLHHPELKKREILVIQVKAREVILEGNASWKRYWKMRAKHEAEIFLNGGYQIKKIILESINAISYFSIEIK